jgi:hypothetical protein
VLFVVLKVVLMGFVELCIASCFSYKQSSVKWQINALVLGAFYGSFPLYKYEAPHLLGSIRACVCVYSGWPLRCILARSSFKA